MAIVNKIVFTKDYVDTIYGLLTIKFDAENGSLLEVLNEEGVSLSPDSNEFLEAIEVLEEQQSEEMSEDQ